MTAVLRTQALGKRYRRNWALADCTLDVPAGRVVGLVGPNGAGKTTLLNLAVGLLTPTSGTIEVLGDLPAAGPEQLAKVGFVSQDAPTYAGLTVEDHLRLGARLNPGWDDALARDRIARLGLDLEQRAGKLSGGQRAQLALTLGVAKRPELLILDEPVASLDPLARREFLQDLMESVAEHELSVVLSSHLVSDLERVCDHLIVLVASRVQLAGEVETLLAAHHRLTGERRDPATLPADQQVIAASHTDRQTTLLVRTEAPIHDPAWTVDRLSLEDLVLAYMGQARVQRRPPARAGGAPMIWLTWRQARAQTAMMGAALAVLAVVLLLTGPGLADEYSEGIAACTAQGGDCSGFVDRFFTDHQDLALAVTAVVLVVPALVGIFWGAPLIARELEAGTHRLVWNQSVTRTRWLAVKLGLIGLAAIAAAGLLSFAVDWWADPIDTAAAANGSFSRMEPPLFGTRGIVPIGYAVFAFALGVTVGMLVRRTIAAMAITLAVFVAVQIAMPHLVRPHLSTPTTTNVEVTPENLWGLGIEANNRIRLEVNDSVEGCLGPVQPHRRPVRARGGRHRPAPVAVR